MITSHLKQKIYFLNLLISILIEKSYFIEILFFNNQTC